MAVQTSYPGVYIEEIPSGVRTITGVSTSIAVFIDYFRRGPMNKAVRIFSFGEFEREFGGLDTQSEASYAIQQFFGNGGSQAYVVRVAGGAPMAADVKISDTVGGPMVIEVKAINEGDWGDNIRLSIQHNDRQPSRIANPPDSFHLTITEYNASLELVRQEKFLNLSMKSSLSNFVVKVLNDANSGSKIVRNTATIGESLPAENGTRSGDHRTGSETNETAEVTLTAGNNSLIVEIDGETKTAILDLPTHLPSQPNTYLLTSLALALENAIRTANPSKELFAKASVIASNGRIIAKTGTGVPLAIVSFSNHGTDTLASELLLDNANSIRNIQEYEFGNGTPIGAMLSSTNGDNGTPPDASAIIGSLNSKTGIYALEDVDLFNIMCIPRTAITTGTDAMTTTEADTVMATAIEYCRQKRAFFIMDTPTGVDELPKITTWMAAGDTLRSSYAAIYYPRVLSPDPLNNYRLRSFGASGTIAGLYARTDSDRGVWKAPAGTEANLRNVTQLEDVLSDRENGVLNPLGINCLRNLPIYGNISWGGRTLAGADANASEWKYIPVRRLALFLEESLFRGMHWVVFEPNDEPLWAQIRLNVGAFMNILFKQGAFQGTSPREAYLVKCDRETTTQNDINLGIVNVLIGFAPLKPAEFVFLKIQQLAGQIQS
ncbi:phage tail sheath family protein [Lunatibacter salilacus]|uniref:phage tail sheath family protein n=1 Tax=Lunatibacter salilacus TaxID=2483804 RepID=UPI00131C4386|nr:phage tail sheath C-terminal domain-containing protein [Lunatibacter salilacus]